ncbi:magnesium chelatase subunit ChlI family protein [Borreliella bavariensis]|uniref:magnesium chelatase subunit ChlI family protein n=1 Tax=Borreliella bavariensis TaxID=664662 RepID=UPI002D7F560F|nr:hypothetical protein [Borreliella bavariensis]
MRYENFANINKNSDLNSDHIEKFCELSAILKNDLIYILNKLNISSRTTYSILKIARTISDLKEEKIFQYKLYSKQLSIEKTEKICLKNKNP